MATYPVGEAMTPIEWVVIPLKTFVAVVALGLLAVLIFDLMARLL